MCILMYFGPGAMPIKAHLDAACENNPDGFGYAVITRTDGIVRGHGMDPDRVIAEFMDLRERHPGDSAMFHARIATQGSVCLDNCHPFIVNNRFLKADGFKSVAGEMVLGHNGMLPVYPAKGDDRSDTKVFAEDLFMYRFPHLDSPKTKARLETYIGGSKLVILTTDPAYRQQSYIFNQRLGDWLDHEGTGDIWYSNTSYKPRTYYGAKGYSWTYPTTVGGKSAVETWDDEDSWSTRLACSTCRYALVYCNCVGTVKGIYIPWDEAKVPTAAELFTADREEDDDDESVTWTCLTCEAVGTIDDDGMCRNCDSMFCCNELFGDCVCWDPATKRLRSKEEIAAERERRARLLPVIMSNVTSDVS